MGTKSEGDKYAFPGQAASFAKVKDPSGRAWKISVYFSVVTNQRNVCAIKELFHVKHVLNAHQWRVSYWCFLIRLRTFLFRLNASPLTINSLHGFNSIAVRTGAEHAISPALIIQAGNNGDNCSGYF